MTKRFKQSVQSMVIDGEITSEERLLLKKVAEEEKISDTEANLFIAQELKKRKVKIQSGDGWFTRNSGTILNGIISFGGIVLTAVLSGKKNLNTKK